VSARANCAATSVAVAVIIYACIPGLVFQKDLKPALVQQCLEGACKSSHNSREHLSALFRVERWSARPGLRGGPGCVHSSSCWPVWRPCAACTPPTSLWHAPLAAAGCSSLTLPTALADRLLCFSAVFKPATLTRARPHAQVPGFAVSGKMYVQSVSGSTAAGAAGTAPGGGARRLLGEARRHLTQAQMPTVNIANQTALEDELVSTVAAFNAGLAVTSGRRLLQTPTGLEVDYACAPARSLHTG